MNLNRTLQREILTQLKNYYPEDVQIDKLHLNYEQQELQGNLFYLLEYRLIESDTVAKYLGGIPMEMISAKISAKGLDFLEDDGGVGTILNSITIKFDIKNIRDILQDNIIASSLTKEEKQTLIKRIKGMSGEAIQDVITDLLSEGIRNPAITMFIADILSRYI